MTPITLPSGKYLIVDANPTAKNLQISSSGWLIGYLTIVKLPPGSYTLIGVDPLNLTESEWKGIVEYQGNGMYDDYTLPFGFGYLRTSSESGLSLLTANGHKPGSAVILKVNE